MEPEDIPSAESTNLPAFFLEMVMSTIGGRRVLIDERYKTFVHGIAFESSSSCSYGAFVNERSNAYFTKLYTELFAPLQ